MQSVLEAIGSSLLLLFALSNKVCQVDIQRELMTVVDLHHGISFNIVFETLQLQVQDRRQRLENHTLSCVLLWYWFSSG